MIMVIDLIKILILSVLFHRNRAVGNQTKPKINLDVREDTRSFIEIKSAYSKQGEIDSFEIENIHYRFINTRMTHMRASRLCESYNEELVSIKNIQLANLLAEALSESNLMMDSLWTSGTLDSDKTWKWHSSYQYKSEQVVQELIEKFVYHKKIKRDDRRCLAFSRNNHDEPQFRPLPCDADRAVFCQRPVNIAVDGSTHPGWIKYGERSYKIFAPRVSWEDARERCVQHDIESDLAVFDNLEGAIEISRFLLIGRPSLERAWIGADWKETNYYFENEAITLENTTDSFGYPPWLYGKMRKSQGCLLLDRHLGNITLFIEDQCHRLHSYICYKFSINLENFMDFILDDYGYRLYFLKKTWFDARDFCKNTLANYNSHLVEVKEKIQLAHLMYMMGENQSAVDHIWIGGEFQGRKWIWDSSKTVILQGKGAILNWVQNKTYHASVERNYVCLVTDRENHIVAINYGTICTYKHRFICQFTKENLKRLQQDKQSNDQINEVRRR